MVASLGCEGEKDNKDSSALSKMLSEPSIVSLLGILTLPYATFLHHEYMRNAPGLDIMEAKTYQLFESYMSLLSFTRNANEKLEKALCNPVSLSIKSDTILFFKRKKMKKDYLFRLKPLRLFGFSKREKT